MSANIVEWSRLNEFSPSRRHSLPQIFAVSTAEQLVDYAVEKIIEQTWSHVFISLIAEVTPPNQKIIHAETPLPATQYKINSLMHTLDSLQQIPVDWNGYGSEPPNEVSVTNARSVFTAVNNLGYLPTSVSASAEGGVGISFINGNRYADIECFNTGEIWAVTSDGTGNPQVWRVASPEEIVTALETIRGFIQA